MDMYKKVIKFFIFFQSDQVEMSAVSRVFVAGSDTGLNSEKDKLLVHLLCRIYGVGAAES